MSFQKIKPEELNENVFQMIGNKWMLITAEKDGKANTMTASWGGLGILFGKPVAYFFIRPQRYTKEFVDAADRVSLSFFGEEYRDVLNYWGPYPDAMRTRSQKPDFLLSTKQALRVLKRRRRPSSFGKYTIRL